MGVCSRVEHKNMAAESNQNVPIKMNVAVIIFSLAKTNMESDETTDCSDSNASLELCHA